MDDCSSCMSAENMGLGMRCLICSQGFYGEFSLGPKMELKCKAQGDKFKGCISVSAGACKICDKGYYMNQDGACLLVEDDESE